ncbi:TPA: condensation domain-containing protein, partial [Serratia fonticola]
GDERRVSLPLYAWQRERYWTGVTSGMTDVTSGATHQEEQKEEISEQHIDWDAGSETELRQVLLRFICAEAARILSLPSADDIDNTQPLSERGLDSLMALELRKGLGRKTGLTLPATLVFDYPAPSALADSIFSHYLAAKERGEYCNVDRGSSQQAKTPVQAKPSYEICISALSSGQLRLWFLEKINITLPVNNIHHGVKFSCQLDAQRLRACFAVLVARHESLRTTFVDIPVYPSGQEEPRALIAPRGAVPLDVIDLSMEQDRQSQIDRLAYTHRMRSFDISNGPLWRSLLITEEDHSHLLLTQHHLISDGWSVVRLIKELVALYLSPDLLAEPQLAEPDYSDYVSYQRRSLAGEQHQQNLAWWQKKLTGLPRLSLPIAKSTPSPTHNGDAVRIDINRALTEQVRRFSQQNSCTVFVTLLSAWACTLYRYSGQTDFGIGTLSAGRENSDFDEVQGFFVNILVLRPALSASMSFAEFVKAMSLDVLESLRRQDTEFSEIAAGFTGSRSLDLNPLVQTSFDFNTYPAAYTRDDFGYEWLDFVRGDAGVEGTTRFNLGLSLLEKSSGI